MSQSRRTRIQLVLLLLATAALPWLLLPLLLPEWALTVQPRRGAVAQVPVAVPESYVLIPVSIPLAGIEKMLGERLPPTLVSKRDKSGGRETRLTVTRRGPVKVNTRPGGITVSVPLAFRARTKLRGPIRPSAKTRGALTVFIDLTPSITESWQPKLEVNPRFRWDRRPKIDLGLFKVSVSDLAGREIQKALNDAAQDLERKVGEELQLKARAEEEWAQLHRAFPLREQPPVWLAVDPQAVFLEPVTGDATHLNITLGLAARVSTALATQPPLVPQKPLPPLKRASPKRPSGFSLGVPVLLGYAELEHALTTALRGRRVELDHGAIVPERFEIYPSGSQLVVGVHFTGDAPGWWLDTRGIVYLTGMPAYDPISRIFRVEEFAFTRRVSNPLVRTATWVLQDSLRAELQRRLVFDLGGRIDGQKQRLSEKLNRPLGRGFESQGEVRSLDIESLRLEAQGLALGLRAEGALALRYSVPVP